MRFARNTMWFKMQVIPVAVMLIVAAGCAKDKPARKVADGKESLGKASAGAVASMPHVKVEVPRSTFSVDPNLRDPFFPKSKRMAQATANAQPTAVIDLPRSLEAEFQGVMVSGDQKIAVINNVLLEAGRKALIPIHSGGQVRQVAVHCTEVTSRSVVLEVEGYPHSLTITRPQHP